MNPSAILTSIDRTIASVQDFGPDALLELFRDQLRGIRAELEDARDQFDRASGWEERSAALHEYDHVTEVALEVMQTIGEHVKAAIPR